MRLSTLTASIVALYAMTSAVSACTFIWEGVTKSQMVAQSKPVAVDRQCRTINAGIYDELSLGPATDLGDGRVQQVLNEPDKSRVLLADCNTREVTILRGAETEYTETSCGRFYSYGPVTGDDAPMSLSVGANLHELVDLAAAKGIAEIDPNDYFSRFRAREGRVAVGRKDRFDLLCGCKRLYPDSPGAQK
ncbi:MAG: hypothetical protein IOC80_13745 [Rhodobacter sp.]|nr:hypothetical protein [Rhodobacter sp.]MCA3513528.1 hypothetical protein [Rhodobacter sp.]MCA3520056.1 hypothetical protein [Rhodobacter sp.]MCA3522985.1 hypothetical protein [Rhodobacter sp.]MCA3525168.1 hypothetical protein [Rhodobacter sp.]